MQAWKVVLAAVVVAAGGSAAWMGWAEHSYRQEIKALTPQVRLVGLHLGAIAAKRAGSGVTFAEYLGHIEKAIAELDQVALQIGAQAPSRANVASAGALQYNASAQDVMRAVLSCGRVAMGLSSAINRSRQALADANATDNSYAVNAALERAKRASADSREELEAGAKIGAEFPPKLELITRQAAWVGRTFGPDVQVSQATVDLLANTMKDCS